MAFGNSRLTQTDLFIKSSVSDLQDPVFLTFDLDFFPVRYQFPRYDGLYNNSLLIVPPEASANSGLSDPTTHDSNNTTVFPNDPNGDETGPKELPNPNRTVEYSAYNWLSEYYGPDYSSLLNQWQPHPATALLKMITELRDIQSAPWYFQSISGVPDLWKQAQRVKEGNIKTTLTINCLESIRQPLTKIAENYRWAVYDMERLSYRLPDNLRWFDLDIKLMEFRNLVDHGRDGLILPGRKNTGLELFVRDSAGNIKKGIKITSFKCKMCEFDFSDFLSSGGSQNEFTVSPEKPFYPSFKINVGWVIHEEMTDEDSELVRQSSILTGALNAVSNRLTNTLSAISNLPRAIGGSLVNQIQTKIEGAALGNVYNPDALGVLNNAITGLSGALTGRRSPVGPAIADLTGSQVYPERGRQPVVGRDSLGDAYPEPGRAEPGLRPVDNTYGQPPAKDQVGPNDIGDVYP